MISFRFHVVSITAVFLALAIGIVVGSTYVDNAVVDQLRHRITSVSETLDVRKAESDQLQSDLGDANDYIDASADYAVTERLTDVPLLLAAARGIDEDAVGRTLALAGRSGATVPGVVWLEARWALANDDDEAALVAILGDDAPTGGTTEELQRSAWETVMAELTASPKATAPTSPVLDGLIEQGFLSVDALEEGDATMADLRASDPSVAILRGNGMQEGLAELVPIVAESSVTAGLPTVAADVYTERQDGPKRSEDLTGAFSDDLREQLSLVDDADLTEGQVGVVIALDAAADGVVGHFGRGKGAAGPLPAWTAP
jgi:hypothetical protein